MPRNEDAKADGVGAVNARSDVAIFVRPLAERPVTFRSVGDAIVLFSGDLRLHSERYGSLVVEGIAKRHVIQVFEIDAASDLVRSSPVRRAA